MKMNAVAITAALVLLVHISRATGNAIGWGKQKQIFAQRMSMSNPDVIWKPVAPAECCTGGDCTSYRGTMNIAENGLECHKWDDLPAGNYLHPSRHPGKGLESNYCRNPGKYWGDRAFCWVKEDGVLKVAYCNVPKCKECCIGDCSSYRGTLNVGENGQECMKWEDLREGSFMHPARHPGKGLESNYCRDPAWGRPMCLAKDGGLAYCNVPKCTAEDITA